jgi:Fe-S-cluster containining protein
MELKVIEDSKLCTACGGHCCKSFPGGTTPEDWGAPDMTAMRERLIRALSGGEWVVDRASYVRPSVTGGKGPTRWGRCVFLKNAGCRLSYAERPFGCRDFKPAKDYPHGCCSASGAAHPDALSARWADYAALLLSANEVANGFAKSVGHSREE